MDEPELEPEDEIDSDLSAALKDVSDPTEDEENAQDLDEVEDDAPDTDSIAPAVAVAATAAAAVGMTRPRSKGNRARARTIPGTDVAPEKAENALSRIVRLQSQMPFKMPQKKSSLRSRPKT